LSVTAPLLLYTTNISLVSVLPIHDPDAGVIIILCPGMSLFSRGIRLKFHVAAAIVDEYALMVHSRVSQTAGPPIEGFVNSWVVIVEPHDCRRFWIGDQTAYG
jgi:hypothetical protein